MILMVRLARAANKLNPDLRGQESEMLTFQRWKITLVLVIAVLGSVYAMPNFLARSTADSLPSWLPHEQINLGLDLQGGSHLLLEVDIGTVVAEQLEALVDEVLVALRGAGIGYTGRGRSGERVKLQLRDTTQIDVARPLLVEIDPSNDIEVSADGFVSIVISESARQERQVAVLSQSIEIVRRRIDETGTREPTRSTWFGIVVRARPKGQSRRTSSNCYPQEGISQW